MNPELERLHPYPFERLRALFRDAAPPDGLDPINLGIGEPRHPTPRRVVEALAGSLEGMSRYPATRGLPALREAIAEWAASRFRLPAGAIDPDRHMLPVSGTREALFAVAQAVIDRRKRPLAMLPNPFYQIYEGAALLAGAEPRYLPCTAANGFLPAIDAITPADWERCQLLYVCSPGNPSGAVIPASMQQRLLELARRHGFVIAADECYSELYPLAGPAPTGFLETAHRCGISDFRNLLVFHSLSKRSNAPGLRSGFVAGDPALIGAFLLYRTYHGCALPEQTQAASIAAWRDESHVRENRRLYEAKFDAVLAALDGCLAVTRPEAGFYLWPRTPIPDERFARELYHREHVTVLPGTYLSRSVDGHNPGAGHIRMALVASREECVAAAQRIQRLVRALGAA